MWHPKAGASGHGEGTQYMLSGFHNRGCKSFTFDFSKIYDLKPREEIKLKRLLELTATFAIAKS